jgi:Family of unknown function (DUF6496)
MAEGIGPKGRAKAATTMREFAKGTLHSGSDTGPKVTNPAQAKAIAMNQARKASGDGSNRPRIKSP